MAELLRFRPALVRGCERIARMRALGSQPPPPPPAPGWRGSSATSVAILRRPSCTRKVLTSPALQSPQAPCSRAPIPDLLLGRRQGRPGRARLAVRGPELTAARMGEFRSEWSGMPADAEITPFAQLPQATGAGIRECDFPPVPEAGHGLQRDGGTLVRDVLPLDPQELRLWLHRLRPRRAWSQPADFIRDLL